MIGGGGMEQLIQKYMKYFYIALLSIISIRLLGTVWAALTMSFQSGILISIILLLVNMLLLIDSIKHNIRQQFTECKADAKILRFTLGLLIVFHMLTYFETHFDWAILTDHMMILFTVEIVLSYRIQSIEHLERLANTITTDSTLSQKGG